MNDLVSSGSRVLSRPEFQGLATIPPEAEWFENIRNPNTRRAYRKDVSDLLGYLGLENRDELALVNRAHVIAWRKDLELRGLSAATIRRKLAAISAMFLYLCEANAVPSNPVHGVARPREGSNEGKTPALSDVQARALLEAPDPESLKGRRDRSILACLLYHALRREELAKLRIRDRQSRGGIVHLVVHGKGDKLRYVPLHPHASRLIDEYLEALDPTGELKKSSPLFRTIRKGNAPLDRGITVDGIYKLISTYGVQTGISEEVDGLSPHAMRTTAATNALLNEADIAKVQEWLGHSNIATTRMYDRRTSRPEDSPTFRVKY